MTTTVPANERGPASATDANPTRVETHPAVLPPDVEGLKPVTSTGDDDANQEDSTEREQLKSKGSDHELCHHVHHSDRYVEYALRVYSVRYYAHIEHVAHTFGAMQGALVACNDPWCL